MQLHVCIIYYWCSSLLSLHSCDHFNCRNGRTFLTTIFAPQVMRLSCLALSLSTSILALLFGLASREDLLSWFVSPIRLSLHKDSSRIVAVVLLRKVFHTSRNLTIHCRTATVLFSSAGTAEVTWSIRSISSVLHLFFPYLQDEPVSNLPAQYNIEMRIVWVWVWGGYRYRLPATC